MDTATPPVPNIDSGARTDLWGWRCWLLQQPSPASVASFVAVTNLGVPSIPFNFMFAAERASERNLF